MRHGWIAGAALMATLAAPGTCAGGAGRRADRGDRSAAVGSRGDPRSSSRARGGPTAGRRADRRRSRLRTARPATVEGRDASAGGSRVRRSARSAARSPAATWAPRSTPTAACDDPGFKGFLIGFPVGGVVGGVLGGLYLFR